MNSPQLQELQQVYKAAQSTAVRSGRVRAKVVDPEIHRTLDRLLWVAAGMFVTAIIAAGLVGLLFW